MTDETAVIEFIRKNPGCTPDQLINVFGNGAADFTSGMVRDQVLARWYVRKVPHYYIPVAHRPHHELPGRRKTAPKSLLQRIDTELSELGFLVCIEHIQQPEECYYKVVTVATPAIMRNWRRYDSLTSRDVLAILHAAYNEASETHRSDLSKIIIQRFSEAGAGVALCHHNDPFSSVRGREISEGRLLKLLKKEEKQ